MESNSPFTAEQKLYFLKSMFHISYSWDKGYFVRMFGEVRGSDLYHKLNKAHNVLSLLFLEMENAEIIRLIESIKQEYPR